jgi:hypothetical protein
MSKIYYFKRLPLVRSFVGNKAEERKLLRGSGKYPYADSACKELGIPFAGTAEELADLLAV